MLKLEDIQKPISECLVNFDKKFRASMQSSVPMLNHITRYIIKRKGKQMRPMFVFLSAGLSGGINESTYRGAALVELLHTASLVHDDVVDNAYERRGIFSVNALWKNKVAVLVGDFLLSKGLSNSVEHQDFQFLNIMSKAVEQMAEGELLQIERARKQNIKKEVYFEIIRKKTASLIASCCATGATSANTTEANIQRLALFGEKVGIAFQIKDDLFDYGSKDVGKPIGNDVREGKLTLPIIYALEEADEKEKRHIINLVKNHNEDKALIDEVIQFVRSSEAMDRATECMLNYQKEAFEILASFPSNEYKEGLQQLVRYTTEREI